VIAVTELIPHYDRQGFLAGSFFIIIISTHILSLVFGGIGHVAHLQLLTILKIYTLATTYIYTCKTGIYTPIIGKL